LVRATPVPATQVLDDQPLFAVPLKIQTQHYDIIGHAKPEKYSVCEKESVPIPFTAMSNCRTKPTETNLRKRAMQR